MIPQLWSAHPDIKLCIHCGVGAPGGLKLERRARNSEYVRLDNANTHPPTRTCSTTAPPELKSSVDIDGILATLQSLQPSLLIGASDDAGLFLCEYSLFCSLNLGRAPTVFLHVPPITMPYTLDELRTIVNTLIHTTVAHTLPAPTKHPRPLVRVIV
jgi:hypothetical protein